MVNSIPHVADRSSSAPCMDVFHDHAADLQLDSGWWHLWSRLSCSLTFADSFATQLLHVKQNIDRDAHWHDLVALQFSRYCWTSAQCSSAPLLSRISPGFFQGLNEFSKRRTPGWFADSLTIGQAAGQSLPQIHLRLVMQYEILFCCRALAAAGFSCVSLPATISGQPEYQARLPLPWPSSAPSPAFF